MPREFPHALLGVFHSDPQRKLLLYLFEQNEPVAYSEAREKLGFRHNEQFQRALRALDDMGMIQYSAPREAHRDPKARSYRVFIELSPLGEFAGEVWYIIRDDFYKLARERKIPEGALMGLAAGG